MKILALAFVITASVALAQQRPTFDDWDKNKDQKLSKDELPENARRNFNRVDTNNDGLISREEHNAFLNRRRQAKRPASYPEITIKRDLNYAGNDNPRQALDLLLPKKRTTQEPLPVVVFIHGGAWRSGNKNSGIGRLAPLVNDGDYAGVSVAYRLTAEAQWPSQIHDCKAAIRWIRANAKQHNLDPEKIAVWGSSAGGHLVSMLGVSGGVGSLEGKIGNHLDQSSRVSCVINFFGPSELLTMNDHPSNIDHDAPESPESRLIGGAIQENKAKARAASPITYVTRDDAPFLHVHGTADKLVPYPQSVDLNKKLVAAGVNSKLVTVTDGGHGNFGNAGEKIQKLVQAFLAKHLRGEKGEAIDDLTLDSRGKDRD